MVVALPRGRIAGGGVTEQQDHGNALRPRASASARTAGYAARARQRRSCSRSISRPAAVAVENRCETRRIRSSPPPRPGGRRARPGARAPPRRNDRSGCRRPARRARRRNAHAYSGFAARAAPRSTAPRPGARLRLHSFAKAAVPSHLRPALSPSWARAGRAASNDASSRSVTRRAKTGEQDVAGLLTRLLQHRDDQLAALRSTSRPRPPHAGVRAARPGRGRGRGARSAT